ncbi:MAG: MCE family protein, partial [Verrucomicrobiae bacterium]|nr:MCE family protein [Verrucomicrobiae bacterium]
MQDLTPQLRTRLSRVERAVGCFVLLATLILAAGFSYYIYHTAKRKGWFDVKVSYCTTLPYSAAGLRVGDPVKLMGFDVGEITRIDTQPPEDIFNVYVEFQIRTPYFGYLWTEGSRARVLPSDFMGNRILEVTKGTNGVPTHLTWEIREYTIKEALEFPEPHRRAFLDGFSFPNQTNRIVPLQPVDRESLKRLAEAGVEKIKVVNRAVETKRVTAVWSVISNCYLPYDPKAKPYWLPPEEAPALTERLDTLLQQTERNLPSFFAMTNQLAEILSNATLLTAHADQLLVQAQPLVTNLTTITSLLSQGEGALGRWLLPPELYAQTLTTISNANQTLTNASAALTNASAMLV